MTHERGEGAEVPGQVRAAEASPTTVDTPAADYKRHRPGGLDGWLLASGPLAWLLAQMAGRWTPGAVEAVYGSAIGPALGGALARATGWIPFSVAEWFLLGLVGFEGARLVRGLRIRGSRRRGLGVALLRLTRDLSVLVAIFYLVWGFHYARPRLPERQQWPALAVDTELLATLLSDQIERANEGYRRLHGGAADTGIPTTLEDPGSVDRALDRAWVRVVEELQLPSSAGWPRGPVKGLLISPLLHRLGLSGFYFPFTGEANLNVTVPAVRRAHVMAHEKAHQRGIGPEDEANFLGWRAAALAQDLHANYAAAVFAQSQLSRTLHRLDPERARAIVGDLLPGVRRDLQDLRVYWSRAEGPARTVARRVNDAYLHGNRVEGGIESYGRSARLLVRFALARGGDLGPTPSQVHPSVPSSRP